MNTMERVREHYEEGLKHFPEPQTVGIFLQGSQNYGLSMPTSDVDTKLIVLPSFKDIAMNYQPISTTFVRANDEHIDFKDLRLYMGCFYKQNLNFLEILFTPYKILNPLYEEQWFRLIEQREAIAHMNPVRAVKTMMGIAREKYHAMEHPYPTKLDIIEKYGFDGKQVHHLLRVEDYMRRYIAGESYEECLRPTLELVPRLMDYKQHRIPLEIARLEAAESLARVEKMYHTFADDKKEQEDAACRALLEDVQYEIMKISVKNEIC